MFSITNECATMYLFQNQENSLKEAEASAQKEADALRQLVEPKREEAVEAVITSLV